MDPAHQCPNCKSYEMLLRDPKWAEDDNCIEVEIECYDCGAVFKSTYALECHERSFQDGQVMVKAEQAMQKVVDEVRRFRSATGHRMIQGRFPAEQARQALFDALDRLDKKSTRAEQAKMDDETISKATDEALANAPIRCDHCGWKGQVKDAPEHSPKGVRLCPKCGLERLVNGAEKKSCPVCQGRGTVSPLHPEAALNSNHTCLRCRGTGVFRQEGGA